MLAGIMGVLFEVVHFDSSRMLPAAIQPREGFGHPARIGFLLLSTMSG